jgi:hypothetical protein
MRTTEKVEVKPLKQGWLQMGVELEGSWTISRSTVAGGVRGAKAVNDPSVKIGHGDPGEIITRPHANLEELIADVSQLYPDNVHVSCGMHVHASFTPMNGSVIASADFYNYFKKEWEKWGKKMKLDRHHEFWVRLSGSNKNARDEFNPEVQLKGDGRGGKGGHARYTMLNFYAWEIHKTVECRLLPMFQDKNISIEAIRHLGWIYDSYLSQHGFTPLSFEASSQLRGETVLETYKMRQPDTTPAKFEAKGFFPKLETGADIFYAIPGVGMDEMLPFKSDTGKNTP